MSQFLLFPVFFPFLAGPFAYWIGCWYEKARNTFVMSAAALELFLVLTLWTKPELAQATAVVEGFCGMGIQLRAGGFHTLMALLTATGWMAATVFCREYMIHVHKRNRFYLFWLMTLGATMGVFLSGDLFTAFLFFEVMSFTSFVLVIQTEEYPALKAGGTYLAVAVIGGLAALTGLFLLYRQLGTLSLDAMAAAAAGAEDRGLLWVGGLLVLVGLQPEQYFQVSNQISQSQLLVRFVEGVAEDQHVSENEVLVNSTSLKDGIIVRFNEEDYLVHLNDDNNSYTLERTHIIDHNVYVNGER